MKKIRTMLTVLFVAALGSVFAQPYADYEGTTIVVSWPTISHFQKAAELIPQFEEETGISVEVDFTAYGGMLDRQLTEVSKPGNGDFDVIAWVVFSKNILASQGFLTPLAQFLVDPKLTAPDYDIEDLVPAFVTTGGKVGGAKGYLDGAGAALVGVPFGAETSILVYRKDIFEEYDLSVPTTYDELLETAAFITENVPDMYGMASRGGNGAHGYLLHLSPYGGTVLDDNFVPALDSAEALAAANAFKTIVENSPPGSEANGFGEQVAAFLQGDSAMYLDTYKVAAQSRDPEQSTIDGNVGYALHPSTATGCGSETGGFAMGIPANSANKEAAWLFIQWMTKKETDVAIVEAGGDAGRLSTFADPALQERFPEYPVILEQLETCAALDWRPLIPQWGEVNTILGEEMGAMLTEQKTPEEALANANARLLEALSRAGYYSWQ